MLLKAQKMGLLPQKEVQPLSVAGRLGHFVDTWKVLTNDPWVLQAVNSKYPLQPEHNANRTGVSPRAGSSSEGGTPVFAGKGSCSTCARQSGRLLLESLPGTQEEWSNETSDQPEAVEPMRVCRIFQDGGNPHVRVDPSLAFDL